MPVDLTRFTPLSRNIQAFFGVDVRLADGSTIRAVHYPDVESQLDEYQATVHETYPLIIAPGGAGTLSDRQYVRLQGALYYVASVQPLKLGWSAALLQRAEASDAVLVVDGQDLSVDDNLLQVTS